MLRPQPDDGDGYYAMDERKLCACFPSGPGQVVHDKPFLVSKTSRQPFIGGAWAAKGKDRMGMSEL